MSRTSWRRWWIPLVGEAALFAAVCCFAGLSGSLNEHHIVERIKPVAEVTVEGGSAASTTTPAVVTIGQQHYEAVCKVCHGSGLMGAPKFGDKKAWAPRIAEGIEVLVKHALEGYKAMPPKGGCSTCSEEEIRKTVEYMISEAK